MKDLPTTMQISVTGNGIDLGNSDLIRRAMYCRLEYLDGEASKREHFAHGADDMLIQYVKVNRAELVRAALMILIGYQTAGRPKVPMPTWGSYTAWSLCVRAPMIWAGLPDPMETRGTMEVFVGDESSTTEIVLNGLFEIMGYDVLSLKDVLSRYIKDTSAYPAFTETLRAIKGRTDLPELASDARLVSLKLRRYLSKETQDGKRLSTVRRETGNRKATDGWMFIGNGNNSHWRKQG